jgi:beta-phosphoglucomutase-like phosphatase (HAD superfamily)
MPADVLPMEPPAGTQALLFDCDGTLVDTLRLYRICWRQTFGRHGFDMTDEWFETWLGHDVHYFVAKAFPHASDDEREAITLEGMTMFLDSTHLLEPLEHVVKIARSNHGRIPMAVVSGGLRHAVLESLEAVGIREWFDPIVTLDDVDGRGKPAPDAYLKAMGILGVDPAHCVAYEDSTSGIESAKAAGIGNVVDVRWHDPA